MSFFLPDSFAPVQAAMWRRRDGGEEVEQVVMVFKAEVGAGVVARAWEATVEVTEVLGYGLCVVGGDVGGMERRPVSAVMRVMEGEPDSVEAWLEDDRRRGFEWAEGVPWRVAWWPEAGRWVWTFHHGLLDGRSIGRILTAFLRRVRGGEGEPLRLARWGGATVSEEAAAVNFYRGAFSGLGPAEIDFAGVGRGAVVETLGGAMVEALEAVAAQAGVTVATIVTWAWGQVVARAAGVGAVVLGQVRSGPSEAGVAGFTMNTLPLVVRRRLEGKGSDGWRALREEMLALRAFERAAPETLPSGEFRTPDGPWIGTIMVDRGTLAHRLGEDAAAVVESVELRERPSGRLTACAYLRPELRLEVEAGEGIGPGGAAALLAHWAAVLRAVAVAPEAEAAEMTRLPRPMEATLARWEDGGPELPGAAHVADAWRATVAAHTGETAVWTPEAAWTYEETDHRVRQLAAALQADGVGPAATVAVGLARRTGWLIALLALACLGAVYMPLARRLPAARLRQIIQATRPEVLVCDSGEVDDTELRRVRMDVLDSVPDVTRQPSCGAPVVAEGWGAAMALFHTSGSTGMPKGVLVEHRGVLNEARWAARALELGPGDRLLQFASPAFDASLEEMLACALSGATLVTGPEEIRDDFDAFDEFIRSAGVTVLDLPTAFWSAWSAWMRQTGRTVPPLVRSALIGGEKATLRALADWRAAGGGTLWNSYGPTEASVVATALEIGRSWHEEEDPPIGRPIPGCVVRVADDLGQPMPWGAAGEIWIGGPAVGPGYPGQPEWTAAVFLERDGMRWYRTGDRARWDAAGRLRFLGRRDDQLKIRGQRVEPGSIVQVLESYPGVVAAHAGAVGTAHRPVLAAWVHWDGPAPDEWPNLLRSHLLSHLPAAALPVRWAVVTGFGRTENGKLDRRALPEPRLWGATREEAAATPTERRLAAFWEELLEVGPVGRHDSFFDLGGDSLQALRLFAWLAEELGVKMPMATLMQSPTLAGLARAVDDVGDRSRAAGHAAARPVEVPVPSGGGSRPLFCIHGGDGGVLFYRELARHLPATQPLVTIEAPVLCTEDDVRVRPVEESAAAYVEAVRRHQPEGPYRLAGYSYGGVLVYEMAAQLRAAGEIVAFLGLFDTHNPALAPRRYRLKERLAVFLRSVADQPAWTKGGRLLGRIGGGMRTHLRARLETMAARHAGRTRPHSWLRTLQVREAHAAAMDAYVPRPIDAPVILIKATALDDKYELLPDYGWRSMTPELEVVEVPGSHLTMFAPENAPRLAMEVSRRLGDLG